MKTATGNNQLYILIFKIVFSAIIIAISLMANGDSLDTGRRNEKKYLPALSDVDKLSVSDKYQISYNPADQCELMVFKIYDRNDELIYEKKLLMKDGAGEDRLLFILLNKSDFLFRDRKVYYYMLRYGFIE